MKDGVVHHFGCFGRNGGYEELVCLLSKRSVICKVFALDSKSGEFVSPLIELPFAKAIWKCDKTDLESKGTFRMDDSGFYSMISSEYKDCEYLMEMQLAEWSRTNACEQGGLNGNANAIQPSD